jgi:drug/metabolite transporter (DMT)-like permease
MGRVSERRSVATMPHEATLIYSTTLLRQAVFAFWRRSVGVGFFVALLIAALGLVVLVALGQASWIIGGLAAVLVLGIAFAIVVYVVHYRRSLRKFRQMDQPRATFRADDSSFTMSSDIGTTTLQWSAVKELWQFPNVWLLLYSKAQFTTLPLACLPAETQTYIVQRVRESGGKVDG